MQKELEDLEQWEDSKRCLPRSAVRLIILPQPKGRKREANLDGVDDDTRPETDFSAYVSLCNAHFVVLSCPLRLSPGPTNTHTLSMC